MVYRVRKLEAIQFADTAGCIASMSGMTSRRLRVDYGGESPVLYIEERGGGSEGLGIQVGEWVMRFANGETFTCVGRFI